MTEQRRRFFSKMIYLLVLSSIASNAAPQILRIDGSLYNASGAPITGSRDIQIKAFDAASGGSAVWTSSVYNTSVTGGRFSIALDATADTTSLTSRLAAKVASGEIWFEIHYDTGTANGSMDSDVTVAPRIRGKGTLFALVAAKADALTGVTATVAELNRLAGITSSVQSQIDAAFSAISGIPSATNRVAKAGDTMTGGLGLQYAGVTPSRVAYVDANRQIMTSNTVTNTELDFLGGVTSNLGAKVNLFTNAEAGYLAGVTTNIGSKMNLFTATEAGYLSGVTSNVGSKLNLATTTEFGYLAGVTTNIGSKINLFTTTEAGYLNGVTSNVGSKLNRFTSGEAAYLAGVTAGIQSQLQRTWGDYCSSGYYLRGYDNTGTKMCSALPTNVTAVEITAGFSHACGRYSDGTVKCWGANAYGQIGDNSTNASYVPVYARNADGSKISDAVSIAANYQATYVVRANGTIASWGYNGYGNLGDGSVTGSYIPLVVSGITTAVEVTASGHTACARKSDGTVWCWGYNPYGGLGDNSTTDRYTPVQVVGITNAVNVSTGGTHTCAVLADGTAKCWGYNGYGNIGDNSTTQRLTPRTVTGLTGVTAIAAGKCYTTWGCHTCAVLASGGVKCWGYNGYGEVGDGGTTQRNTPVSVLTISTATKVKLGGITSCALLADGSMKCWGYSGAGAIGDGATTDRQTAVSVLGVNGSGTLSSATSIDMSDNFNAGINSGLAVSGGRVVGWGDADSGMLGNNNVTDSTVPVGAQD